MRFGVDTGGTFTDLVDADGRVHKVPSTPDDPARAVRTGLGELDAEGGPTGRVVAHGTTVATNVVLEGRLAPVALVTTAGLGDVIEIARQDRPSLYDAFADRPPPLVPRPWRLEVPARRDAGGRVLVPLRAQDVPTVPDGAAVVAVCLLHSDLDPADERAVGAVLVARGHAVVLSCDVSPELREYERTTTTVLDAGLGPACRPYLTSLDDLADDVLVMTSAGGLVPLEVAVARPASLLLSGPAGGVLAAAALAERHGFAGALSFDMGGTSTDVCLIEQGRPEPAGVRTVAGYPVRLPALDVHTVGAGGGSIAGIDAGGALVVGPRSAGALPGPACYGRGGVEPTVTDADLVLGRIPAGAPFPGIGELDRAAAKAALAHAGVDAEGVVAVVDATMAQALRRVSVSVGRDPRELALVAFGGAGPLHACALADALGMAAVVVPPRAGVFSAVGLLGAPTQRDLVRSWPTPREHGGLGAAIVELAEEAAGLVGGHAVTTTGVDARYAGQGHELTVPGVAAFASEHLRRNGYLRPGVPVEVVALRASAARPAGVAPLGPPAVRREVVVGPAVVAEPDCTTWVPEGWRGEPADDGTLVLRRGRR